MKITGIIRAFTFAGWHFLFVILAMLAGCFLWTVAYFVLLLVAVIGDFGAGGPLAWPAGLAAVILACSVIGWGIFAPATACGALFCALFKLPRLAAIPVVAVTAFLLSYLLSFAYTEWVTTHPAPRLASVLNHFIVFLSVPLGIYWWLTEGPGALLDWGRRWLRKRQERESPKRLFKAPE